MKSNTVLWIVAGAAVVYLLMHDDKKKMLVRGGWPAQVLDLFTPEELQEVYDYSRTIKGFVYFPLPAEIGGRIREIAEKYNLL